MSCITGDYAAGFLGSSEGCAWNMKPFEVRHTSLLNSSLNRLINYISQLIDTPDLKVDRGQGNHVSVEFSILYRVRSRNIGL